MKNLIFLLLFIFLSILLINCASTYKAPSIAPPKIEENVTGSKSELFEAAKKVLLRESFIIRYSDENSGIISALKKQMKLNKNMADCGTTLLPSLMVHEISTEVALNFTIDENKINITSAINAEDIRGNVRHKADLTCISLGTIENDIIQKIGNQIRK